MNFQDITEQEVRNKATEIVDNLKKVVIKSEWTDDGFLCYRTDIHLKNQDEVIKDVEFWWMTSEVSAALQYYDHKRARNDLIEGFVAVLDSLIHDTYVEEEVSAKLKTHIRQLWSFEI